MNAADFKQFLKTSANDAKLNGRSLLLEVINDDSITSPVTSIQPSIR
jgi:hypothetical protein